MLGVRGPIQVPGTCWAEPGFASNAGRQVPDPGARQSDSSRHTTAWQRMATTWQRMATTWQRMATTWQRMATTRQRMATIGQIRRIGDARIAIVSPAPLRPYPPHSNQCSPHRFRPAFSDSFCRASVGSRASAGSGASAGSLCVRAQGSLPRTHSHPRTNGSSS
jgi:hypothetical protein